MTGDINMDIAIAVSGHGFVPIAVDKDIIKLCISESKGTTEELDSLARSLKVWLLSYQKDHPEFIVPSRVMYKIMSTEDVKNHIRKIVSDYGFAPEVAEYVNSQYN